jgi:hypothetical protein
MPQHSPDRITVARWNLRFLCGWPVHKKHKQKGVSMRNAAMLLLCTSLLTCLPASGQKAALFGGYQLTHLDFGGAPLGGSFTLNGWNASLTGGLAPFFGITADFSGAYKSGSKLHTYTFGPEVRAHIASFRPFAHALVGGGTSSGPVSNGATNGLVMFYGGGLDVKAAPFAAVRLGQFDWMVTHWNGSTNKNNFRYSAGVVLSF